MNPNLPPTSRLKWVEVAGGRFIWVLKWFEVVGWSGLKWFEVVGWSGLKWLVEVVGGSGLMWFEVVWCGLMWCWLKWFEVVLSGWLKCFEEVWSGLTWFYEGMLLSYPRGVWGAEPLILPKSGGVWEGRKREPSHPQWAPKPLLSCWFNMISHQSNRKDRCPPPQCHGKRAQSRVHFETEWMSELYSLTEVRLDNPSSKNVLDKDSLVP